MHVCYLISIHSSIALLWLKRYQSAAYISVVEDMLMWFLYLVCARGSLQSSSEYTNHTVYDNNMGVTNAQSEQFIMADYDQQSFRLITETYSECVKMNEISNILHNFRKIVEIPMNFHQNQYEKRRI